MAAQRGLGDPELARGATDAAAISDLDEIANTAKIHRVRVGIAPIRLIEDEPARRDNKVV